MSLLSRALPLAALLAAPAAHATEPTEVLWYNGNNGHTSTDYATFQSTIEGEGGTFTTTTTFPSSLTSYRMVVLVSPAKLFNDTQVPVLQAYLDAGGLLVMLGNSGGEAGSLGVLMNLAEDLGLGSTWVADELDTGCDTDGLGYAGVPATTSVLTTCIDNLTYAGSSDMSAGTGADILFTGESDQPLMILEGSALLVADRDIFFDTCTLDADNTTFFKRLYGGLDAATATDDDCDGYGPESEGGDDCDDADAAVNPGAEDVCDGVDNDCNGDPDDDPDYGTIWYTDADNDGYGVNTGTTFSCEDPEGYADNTSDCDDADYSKHPGADETCNDEDDDCDNTVDEEPVDGTDYYPDLDEDGYGDASNPTPACDQPDDYIAVGGDCDDTLSRVHPDADEYCNEADDDCDGTVDNDPLNAESYYTDADGDGYGDPASVTEACSAPDGTVVDGRDCDDSDATIYPGAPGWTVTCEQLDTGDGGQDTGGGKDGGCACSAASPRAGWWMLSSLGLLLIRRRRR